MTDKGWRGKGEMVLRRSPRKTGKKCGRPFTALRTVTQCTRTTKKKNDERHRRWRCASHHRHWGASDSERGQDRDNNDSEVQSVTETENERDITSIPRPDTLPQIQETLPRQEITVSDSTEDQDKSSDSEDEIPLVTLVRHETGKKLTLQQIQDCKEGPLGERAIGVTIAKLINQL